MNFRLGTEERFHNSRALSGFMQSGISLRKMTLEDSGFGVQQLWNRCSPHFSAPTESRRAGFEYRIWPLAAPWPVSRTPGSHTADWRKMATPP
jgi:hypothetical protein